MEIIVGRDLGRVISAGYHSCLVGRISISPSAVCIPSCCCVEVKKGVEVGSTFAGRDLHHMVSNKMLGDDC
jgi:hypothetical protein